jgi:uncharacterized HAD superfamily protein
MLFAIDIDGTIATHGPYFCQQMFTEAGIALAGEELAQCTYGYHFWHHERVRALPEKQRAELKDFAHAHHKDLDQLENRVPVPGASEALHVLMAEGHRVLYATCRPAEARQITQEWLAWYGFPAADQVETCQHYHSKYLAAHQVAGQREQVILMDDLVERMVPAFRTLAIQHREIALNLMRRLAVVAVGIDKPPVFAKVPFKVLALPSWRPEDLARLGNLASA